MIVKHTHHSLQIVFAILLGYLLITRLFISWVQYAPEQFIESVEWAIDSQIGFERIEVQQNWLGFQFQVSRLEINHADFDLQIQHLDMDVNVFSMLVPTMKFGRYLTIDHGLYYDKKSQEASQTSFEREGISVVDFEKMTEINLDVSQLWQRVKVSDLVFKELFDPDLTLHIYEYQSLKGTQLNVMSEFGVAYKESLNFERFGFQSSFDTNLLGYIEQGDFSLFSFHPLRVEPLAQLLPSVWHQKLPKGELIIDLQGQVSQSNISKLTLNLGAQALRWSQESQTLPKHLGLELVWESKLQDRQTHFKDWHFRLSKIQLDNQYIKAVSPIELNFEENQLLTFRSDYFDIESFKVIVKSLVTNSYIAALFDKTSGLAIEKVEGQFNWRTFQLPRLDMNIKQLKLPETDYPGIELHNLALSKTFNKMTLKTQKPMILSGLNVPKGGGQIELPNQIELTHSVTKGAWVLNPFEFTLDEMPLTFMATASKQGDVDAMLTIKVDTMQRLKQHLPYHLFSSGLESWLKMALVDGKNIQAQVQLKGHLKDFPFQDGSGVFKINASVENTFLKFKPDWPMLEDFTGHIEFTPYQLKITSPRIYVGADAYAQAVEVVIDHLDQKNIALVFKGKVHTHLNNAMSYLTLSPLATSLKMEDFIQNTQFSGMVDVTLDRVWIPLSGYGSQAETVSGRVQFNQSAMTLFEKIPLETIQGTLAFTEQGVTAPKLSASAFNHETLFSVETHQKENTILIKGMGQLLPEKNPFFDASVPWDLSINIPLIQAEASGVDIQLDVEIDKVNSLLPEPFDQKSLKGKRLKVKFDLAKEALFVKADLPEHLVVKGRWESVKEHYQMQQLRVLLGSEIERGFKKGELTSYIRGNIGGGDLDDWLSYASDFPLDNLFQEGTSALNWNTSSIRIDTLTFKGNAYPNVRIEWLKRNLRTALQIKSADVLANIVMKPNSPIEMDVERLRLHTIKSNEPTSHADDHAEMLCQTESKSTFLWPEIVFKGKKIELSGYLVDSLHFHLMDSKERLTISGLQGSFGQGAGGLTGQYLFDKASHKSALSLSLISEKVTEMLRFVQLQQGFTGRKATVKANLFWQGALECFSTKAATGQINFESEEGAIDNIEPGFARLIGLLSVESLARRLKLDLKDVTNEGMVYDQIKGQAQLKSGILQIDSFGLKAPSASVALFGQVNLLKETFKLKAYVTPAIGASIPTIAALAGYANPLAALAVYTFMKVIPGVNENLVTFRYDVTGTWTDPKVSELNSDSDETDKQESFFEVEESILDTQQ